MSSLILVRHGQASFLEADYDRLSETGRRQSRLLAEYWVRSGVRFDAAFSGPRERQIGTAETVASVHREHGREFPRVEVLADWDEFAAEAVVKHLLPGLTRDRPDLARLFDTGAEAVDPVTILKRFQKAFEVVMREWVTGELATDGIEPWGEFRARISRAIGAATSRNGSGKSVVVFTSGGSIAAAVQNILGLTNERAMELAWMVKNGAFTEFVYSRDRMTLVGLNHTPHLDAPELVTYR